MEMTVDTPDGHVPLLFLRIHEQFLRYFANISLIFAQNHVQGLILLYNIPIKHVIFIIYLSCELKKFLVNLSDSLIQQIEYSKEIRMHEIFR